MVGGATDTGEAVSLLLSGEIGDVVAIVSTFGGVVSTGTMGTWLVRRRWDIICWLDCVSRTTRPGGRNAPLKLIGGWV